MAGLYYPGKKMPNNCAECGIPCKYMGDIVPYRYHEKRHEACPLIEVPNHGRLGDLDKLESGLRLCAKYQTGDRQQGMLGCCETIRTAPTIIPASKEEDE